jgi:hypothetical protein
MRTASIVVASALAVVVVLTAWARWDALHPASSPPADPADLSPGQDQARVVVREIRLIHGGEDDVQKVLRGRFPRRSVRILVHSPGADLGVSRAGERGVLHRHREGSGGRYWFLPDSDQEG